MEKASLRTLSQLLVDTRPTLGLKSSCPFWASAGAMRHARHWWIAGVFLNVRSRARARACVCVCVLCVFVPFRLFSRSCNLASVPLWLSSWWKRTDLYRGYRGAKVRHVHDPGTNKAEKIRGKVVTETQKRKRARQAKKASYVCSYSAIPPCGSKGPPYNHWLSPS